MNTAAEAARQLVQRLELALEETKHLQAQIDATPTDPAKAELMGVAEVAAFFDVAPGTVTMWALRGRMPEPLARLAIGSVWNRAQMESLKLEREGLDEPQQARTA